MDLFFALFSPLIIFSYPFFLTHTAINDIFHFVENVQKITTQGYKILKVFDMWKWDYTMFDSKTKNRGLFTEDVNMFFKIKQEASDWDREYKTDKIDRDR